MKYNPDKHHRKSIRLKGYDYTSPGAYFITICTHRRECLFGAVVNGEMQLNALGEMVDTCWQRLPLHRPNLTLDAFVVMPNHVHGILILSHPSGRGAALGQDLVDLPADSCPNATPSHRCEPGVACGREMVEKDQNLLPHAAPLPLELVSGSVGAIVLNFKSVTTRTRNRVARSPGTPVWQRNYYDHIVRNEESLQHLRQYIQNNPLSWQEDQLHPDVPSKATDLQKTVLRAPTTGKILKLELRNPDQVVRPGETVAQIAPEKTTLVVKAFVPAQDIGKVATGQTANLRISAYLYPDYGVLEGTVQAIAPDSLPRTTNKAPSDTAASKNTDPISNVYEVTIQPKARQLGRGDRKSLNDREAIQAGMEGTVDIVTKQDTVLKFILRKARILTDL